MNMAGHPPSRQQIVIILVAAAFLAPAHSLNPAASVTLGNVRVQALTPGLIRVEPRGPLGFEDNTTFVVVNRDFAGVSLSVTTNGNVSVLTSSFFTIVVDQTTPAPPPAPAPMCFAYNNADIAAGDRISTCQDESKPCLSGVSQAECCGNCSDIGECHVWIYSPSQQACWLMADAQGSVPAEDRNMGGAFAPNTPASGIAVTVYDLQGNVLWNTSDVNSVGQNLIWPSPLAAPAYAVKDYPRFYVPPWGPTPVPEGAVIDPALVATNGYDFRNDVNGDTYVFLLGATIDSWHAARADFIALAGPTPLVPDYAFGTWFTWWTPYTEDQAKGEIARWQSDQLPLDVWALDMNWRNSPTNYQPGYEEGMDHYYIYPNTQLFPDFAGPGTAWFDFLQAQGLRTYFNDHPYPANNGSAFQTTPAEVNFRWSGLSLWMSRGLTYWWFDANWGFSIPPPNVAYGGSGDGIAWEGMDNRVWGSHVYYESVNMYNTLNPARNHTAPAQRTVTLTKYADGDMVPGLVQHQHPAHHRFPVWWTGDGVTLEASVESMVDSGIYDFKPFVHSDCGGDYRGSSGDLLRWTEHCTFGTVFRYHGADHRPWTYDQATEDTIRVYLNIRYKLLPTFIAAAQQATLTAFPLVARCDLFWPGYPEANDNHQYLHLNDTLVAPIWDSTSNVTSRSVWIPPGSWQDGWSGATVTGPQTITVSQPYERVPLWHRVGGLTVLASTPGLRVDEQDWSELTLEAYPDREAAVTQRSVHARGTGPAITPRTALTMETDGAGNVAVHVAAAEDGAARAWVLRLHLRPGQTAGVVTLDGVAVPATIRESAGEHAPYFPFGGKGAAPAPLAGPIVEVALPTAAHARHVQLRVLG